MSLNIKNEETCRLAEELAALTNENKTQAITIALRERLERVTGEREKRIEWEKKAMRAAAERLAPHLKPGPSSTEIGDFLYGGEFGEPK